MAEFEDQEPAKMPKMTKKIGIIIWAIITVFLAGVIVLQLAQTEWKKIKDGIYQEGLIAGANQLYSLQIKELFSTTQLKMNRKNRSRLACYEMDGVGKYTLSLWIQDRLFCGRSDLPIGNCGF